MWKKKSRGYYSPGFFLVRSGQCQCYYCKNQEYGNKNKFPKNMCFFQFHKLKTHAHEFYRGYP